jgi:hypothetical protein
MAGLVRSVVNLAGNWPGKRAWLVEAGQARGSATTPQPVWVPWGRGQYRQRTYKAVLHRRVTVTTSGAEERRVFTYSEVTLAIHQAKRIAFAVL